MPASGTSAGKLLLAFATVTATLPAFSQGVSPATPRGPLQLAGSVAPLKSPTQVYIVELSEDAAANYKGDTPGFAATKPQPGEKLDASAGAVESYSRYLMNKQDQVLTRVNGLAGKIYSYRYALNGFAARLSAEQVARLARDPDVARIWPDTEQRVQASDSSIFLGLDDPSGGLTADLKLRGEDVVIGVIDSGVAPNHPSLGDTEERIPRLCTTHWADASWLGVFLCHSVQRNPPRVLMYDPPSGFNGVCQTGEGFGAEDCNNKIVGARYYVDGFLAEHELDPGEFVSPRDADGHGTHISTVAAGNSVTASLFGTRLGRTSGIAPRARLAIYKACWLQPGDTRATCSTSDLARAIDDAVADGVDIINYSIGSLETDLTAPDDMALLHALDAGVFSSVAAGNDGPALGTIGSPSSDPWVMTVAASTQKGTQFQQAVRVTAPDDLAGLLAMKEASFTPPLKGHEPIESALALVDDGSDVLADGSPGSRRDACEALANPEAIADRIALIQRGGCLFQVKLSRVEQAGALAAVVYNNSGPPIEMRGDPGSVGIPAVMVGTADGERLVDALVAGTEVRVELTGGVLLQSEQDGDLMAEFSSRGPALSEPNFLKPDVTAPGVNILGGTTPDTANGIRGELFDYQSGTSLSAPEISGIAALLKEAQPQWSPAELKSALMTSAYTKVLEQDGQSPATPLDMGAGRVAPNLAVSPGLAYETTYFDYAAYLCGLEKSPFAASDCAALQAAGFSSDPVQLNLPSIAVAELISGDVVTRRVTNVGPAATYNVELEPPLGVDIRADPTTLSLAKGESGQFSLTFARNGAPLDTWRFGRVSWSDGEHQVGAPIAVRPAALRAPEQLSLAGTAGQARLPVAFGYSGQYLARPHGLRAPLVLPGTVDDDPSNTFTFRFDAGVSAHLINVPPDQLYARFSLFDELTDGNDDLDLYVFYCPNNVCSQVGQSGSFTSAEEVDLLLPPAGLYAVLVHGFQTDQQTGGPGANYSLLAWSFGIDDDVGNLQLTAPTSVTEGDRVELGVQWNGLAAGTRYLGAVSHETPLGLYALTLINVSSP
jgi:subtilisin family serine protease